MLPRSWLLLEKILPFSNSGFDLTGGKISYSIIDFSTNPLGVVTDKNTLFWNGPSDEAMCLINKPNSNDYWLISSRHQTADYYVWPLTGSGIGAPSVYSFSSTGSAYQMNFSKTAGKIVVTGYGNKHVTIIDFNPNTGILSNEIQIGNSFGTCNPARFSPDGTKLYVGTTPPGSPITTPAKLYQYDFTTAVWMDMSFIGACCYAHDLKMGPDGKMYHIHTYYDAQPIAVIDFPDRSAIGNACGYRNITFPDNFNGEVRRFPEFVTLPSPPTALLDTSTADIQKVTIDVLANDYDYDLQNTTLSIDAIEYGPQYGTANIVGNKIEYTPASANCVVDTLIYRIKGLDCATDTAYLIINRPGGIVQAFLDTAICEGQNYKGRSVSGLFNDTLKTATGCDSVLTTNLIVKSRSFSAISVSICSGESYNGHTTSGVYTHTLVNAAACDSIITTTLTVLPKFILSYGITICEGGSYDGYTKSGIYNDTLKASNGCDSIISLQLTVTPMPRTVIDTTICKGQQYLGYTIAGVYTDTLTAPSGCRSVRQLNLIVSDIPQPDLGADRKICDGDSIILYPGKYPHYVWQNGATDSIYTVQKEGLYSVTVINACGQASDNILIESQSCIFYFPSAFTPNGDGRNDYFRILNAFSIIDFYLAVYNRWGEKIFETTDYTKGWDGTVNGNEAPSGNFVWFSRFKSRGTEVVRKGNVMLIR